MFSYETRTRITDPPLFCIHPASGLGAVYRGLANCLGDQQPVWALQARGLEPDEEQFASISEMAQAYIEAIRSIQSAGPYQLLGWSLGGIIAHEIAVQLEAEGEEVALLAMLDSPALTEEASPLEMKTIVRDMLKDAGISEDNIPEEREQQLRLGREFLIDQGLIPASVPLDWGATVVTQMAAAPRLSSAHAKGCCRASVLMFWATLGDTLDSEALNWRSYSGAGQVDIPIATSHTAMLDPEPSAEIARTLATYLLD